MTKLLFIMSPMDTTYELNKIKLNLKDDFKDQLSIEIMNTYKIDEDENELYRCMQEIKTCNMIFITCHGGITYFKSLSKIMEEFQGKKKFFMYSGIEDENVELLKNSGISQEKYLNILKYYLIGDNENFKNMILYLASVFGEDKFKYESPKIPKWEGIYYPGKHIEDYKSFITHAKNTNKPIIAILFYNKYLFENNIEHIECFIEEIENLGGIPIAVYTSTVPNLSIGSRGFSWTLDNILMDKGQPQVQGIIDTIGYSQSILSNPGDGTNNVKESIFEKLQVPVFHALNTYQSLNQWKNSIKGLETMSLAGEVYYPEFDGQIITVTASYSETIKDKIGEKLIFKPIKERVNKISRLALNWVKLRTMTNKDKKIAIIFHNMPPRNDMIGSAFGLDSSTSVFNMVNALKSDGIYTEYDFKNGDEIINKIINGVSNDLEWLTEERVLEKSIDKVDDRTYKQWFAKLTKSTQDKIIKDWDIPLGEFMVFDNKMPIPGIVNGNIFIGLQPSRGFKEKAEELYHSTEITPPHQYIAFYKWIKYVFKANIIVHVGTHGTLEWLPGKEVGLSNSCFPDVVIDDIPNLYPYNISVVGEGIQAKRRSSAVILDHLIPSLMKSGTYDEIDNIDELIKQYYEAKQGSTLNLKYIQQQIIDLALKNNYHMDLNISKEEINKDFSTFIKRFHGWIEEIKNSLIKDGLHIFGQVPKGERFENLVYAFLRLPNGKNPSLIEIICTLYGLDYEHLRNNPYETDDKGKTNLMILDNIENIGRDVITKIHNSGYEIKKINTIMDKYFKNNSEEELKKLYKILYFACIDIKEKLEATTDEIKYFLNGINGGFIPPSGGGSPLRGNIDILPTGRNFYSVDPTSIPSRAAWMVGKNLGDNLIKKYLADEGKYPENIIMVVYAGETMNTYGDDIAEALYLMGVKPKWLGNSDKVVGLEVIPIRELKRPRIDVTLRITGLFRDTFPNIIELIEDAVNLASSIEESEDINYIRRNILNEIKELIKEGKSFREAEDEAGIRVFGCPPGNYGVGIDTLISSKEWNDISDLGQVYTLWSAHAYGRKVHGKKLENVLKRRFSLADATVQNISLRETDILDNDDFYEYHGGIISAIKTYSGKTPKSYCGDNSNPSQINIKDINEETARVVRSRILNPKWFDGLKTHGYIGAQEVSKMIDYVFGWDATADTIKDWMYEKINDTYILNDERRQWMKSVNPWAVHNMIEKLLEANQRCMWNTDKKTIDKLKELYLEAEGDIEELT